MNELAALLAGGTLVALYALMHRDLPSHFKVLRFLLLVTLFACHETVCAQAERLDTESPPESAAEIPVEQDVSDDSIRQRVELILETTSLLKDPHVRVIRGYVKVGGVAESSDAIEEAKRLVLRVDGVCATSFDDVTVNGVVNFDQSMRTVRRSLGNIWNDTFARLPMIVAGFVCVALTWVASRVAGAILKRVLAGRRRIRTSLKDLAIQLLSIGIWVTGLLLAAVITFPGMTPSRALTVLGLGSVAIGFAFKDIFENFFAGVLILWRYPFGRGDVIRCNDITGVVDEINIRNTVLRRMDGQLVVLPNATLFKNPVDVVTSKQVRRQTIICGIAYGEDVATARDVIANAVEQCKTVSGAAPIEIFATAFNSSSVDFEVTWWTGATPLEERQSRDEVITAVKQALDEADIEIPFPYRTLTLSKQTVSETKELLALSQSDKLTPVQTA